MEPSAADVRTLAQELATVSERIADLWAASEEEVAAGRARGLGTEFRSLSEHFEPQQSHWVSDSHRADIYVRLKWAEESLASHLTFVLETPTPTAAANSAIAFDLLLNGVEDLMK